MRHASHILHNPSGNTQLANRRLEPDIRIFLYFEVKESSREPLTNSSFVCLVALIDTTFFYGSLEAEQTSLYELSPDLGRHWFTMPSTLVRDLNA